MASFNLSNLQQVNATLAFLDDQGLTAPAPAGIPTWASSDETICTVTPAADGLGLSADFISVADGTATMTVSLGDLTASVDIIVGASGVASVMNLVMGIPTNKA